MSTNAADDLDAPEGDEVDGNQRERGRYWRLWANGFEYSVKGATGYRLRLIPSNKILGTFATANDAFRQYLTEIDRGRRARMLVIDWCDASGRSQRLSSGRRLTELAVAAVRGTKALHARRDLAGR